MSFSSEVVSIEIKDKVGTLWLDRPEKYNALSEQVWLDIPKALNELVKLDCRVIILAGKGKHFCVGIDLVQGGLSNHLSHASESDATANLKQLEGTKAFQDSISSLANCSLPVIAVIQGHCLGAGIDMITACDIRIGVEDSNILGIYSHMISYPLYLSAYPIGHLIEFQIEEYIKDKNLGTEFERMSKIGKVLPNS